MVKGKCSVFPVCILALALWESKVWPRMQRAALAEIKLQYLVSRPLVQALVCNLLVTLSVPPLSISAWTKHKGRPPPLPVRYPPGQPRPGTTRTQGGTDQRSHSVPQDLTDASVSSHFAWTAGLGAGLLGTLRWEAPRGGSWSCPRGQGGVASCGGCRQARPSPAS